MPCTTCQRPLYIEETAKNLCVECYYVDAQHAVDLQYWGGVPPPLDWKPAVEYLLMTQWELRQHAITEPQRVKPASLILHRRVSTDGEDEVSSAPTGDGRPSGVRQE